MAFETRFYPELIRDYTSQGYWTNISLGDYFRRNLHDYPDKIAVADGQRELTYRELGALVERIAAGLIRAGIRPTQRIAIQLPNSIEFVAMFEAIALIGAVIVPVVPIYRNWEVKYILQATGAVGIVVPREMGGFDYVKMITDISQEVPDLKRVWAVGLEETRDDFIVPYGELTGQQVDSNARRQIDEIKPDPNQPVLFEITSGTEANPKVVMQTHNTMTPLDWYCPMTADDRVLALLPLCHSFGSCMGPYVVLNKCGGTLILSPSTFNPGELLELGERYRATVFLGVPAHYTALLHHPDLAKRDLSSIRFMFAAGSLLPAENVRKYKELVGCDFVNVFGMSETCCGPATKVGDPIEVIANTIGRSPHPAVEIEVFKEDRKTPASPGEQGELAQRGPHIFAGYYNDPVRTSSCFNEEGWLFTGDLAILREDGNLVIAGRKKDIIVRGGRNISPEELENVLYENPKVLEAAAVGMPDPELGERVCLYVALKPGMTLTMEEILEQFKTKQMANFKMPERLELVEALPRTPTGKVRKNHLRDWIADKLKQAQ